MSLALAASSTQLSPTALLPLEVIGNIVETAAWSFGNKPGLLLISRSLQSWVEPALYYSVVLRTREGAASFLRTVERLDGEDPTFLRRYVRHLEFAYQSPSSCFLLSIDSAVRILQACSNITHLSYNGLVHNNWDTDREPLSPSIIKVATAIHSLPNLQHLHLKDAKMYTHLFLPPTLLRLSLDMDYRAVAALQDNCPSLDSLTHLVLRAHGSLLAELEMGALNWVAHNNPRNRILIIVGNGLPVMFGHPLQRAIHGVVWGGLSLESGGIRGTLYEKSFSAMGKGPVLLCNVTEQTVWTNMRGKSVPELRLLNQTHAQVDIWSLVEQIQKERWSNPRRLGLSESNCM
ncbi:hypothetical protein CYLTODRAFT_439981 [Cylindrobasidium torrendii FP15055 ss-10]|uniref:F-box domain-containing protein n=1 Tax=Cylindrobasidium torrendii FP15055 ss-10 TaxID=1314674 RepID=A0A0D7BV03_9AGAR|nr:hypothetical protein CYLTODRAFT_439981 [Cylindrobasidium torrendii FP15055 ss-10]